MLGLNKKSEVGCQLDYLTSPCKLKKQIANEHASNRRNEATDLVFPPSGFSVSRRWSWN